MNRKQRKIKKAIARRHSGHPAIVPMQKYLGRECMIKQEFGVNRVLGWHSDKLAKVIGMTKDARMYLVHCPAFVPAQYGHMGGTTNDGDIFIKDVDKYRLPYSCWWIVKKNLRFK